MADYRIIPSNPVIDAVDRRGQQYMLGLGGQAPTTFSAGVAGVEQGLTWGANLSAKIQETNRLNDPATLAAEQLKRDLENKQTQEAIIQAQLKTPYVVPALEADIAASRATTTGQTLKNQVEAVYGMQEAQSKINQANAAAGASSASAREANARAVGIPFTIQSGVFKNLFPAPKAGDAPFTPGSALNSTNPSVLPTPNISGANQPTDPIAKAKLDLLNSMQQAYQGAQYGEILSQSNETLTKQHAQNLDNQKITRSNDGMKLAEQYNNQVVDATTKELGFDGKPNYAAALDGIAKTTQLHNTESNPVVKQVYSGQLKANLEAITFAGGPVEAQKIIDGMEEGPDKEAAKKIIYQAAAASAAGGDASYLLPDQKAMAAAGLTPEHMANPKATFDKVDQAITSGITNIDDPDFNHAMGSSDYVIAAREASKHGTQSYSIFATKISGGNGATDLAGDSQQSQKVWAFAGADYVPATATTPAQGTISYAPIPQDTKTQAELDLVTKVASQQQISIPAKNQAGQDLNNLQYTQQQNRVSPTIGQLPNAQPTGSPNIQTDNGLDIQTADKRSQAKEKRPPGFPELTDKAQLPSTDTQKIVNIAGPGATTKQVDLARKIVADYNKNTKELATKSDKVRNKIDDHLDYLTTLNQGIELVKQTGNASYFGQNATLEQFIQKIEGDSTIGDPVKNKIKSIFNVATLQRVLGEITDKSSALRSKQALQLLLDAKAGLQMPFSLVQDMSEVLRDSIIHDTEVDNINQIGRQGNQDKALIQRKMKEYTASEVSQPKVYDATKDLYVKNDKFLTAEQFLGLAPVPQEYLTATKGNPSTAQVSNSKKVFRGAEATGSFDTPDVANTPTAQGADVVTPPATNGGLPSANTPFTTNQTTTTTSSTTPSTAPTPQGSALGQAIAKETTPPETNIQSRLDTTDPAVTPAYRALVDSFRNRTGINSVDAAMNGVDYLADSILFNKGGRAMDSIASRTIGGLSPQDAKIYTQAAQQAREEYAKDNKWTALGLDALATAIDFSVGGAVLKEVAGITGALTNIAAEGTGVTAKIAQGAQAVGEFATNAANKVVPKNLFGFGTKDAAGNLIPTIKAGSEAIPKALETGLILEARRDKPSALGLTLNTLGAGTIDIAFQGFGPSIIKGIKNIAVEGGDLVSKVSTYLGENGVPKATINEALTKAQELEVSALGTLPPNVVDTIANAAKSPEGKRAVLTDAARRSAEAEKALSENTQTLQEAITGAKDQATGNILNQYVDEKVPIVQEELDKYYNMVGEKAPNVKGSLVDQGAATTTGGVPSEVQVQKKLTDLHTMQNTINKAIGKPLSNDGAEVLDANGIAIEPKRTDSTVYRKFTEEVSKYKKLEPSIITDLQNRLLGDPANGIKGILPQNGQKIISAVREKLELDPMGGIEPTIQFLDELKQAVGDKIHGVGSSASEAAKEAIIKTADEAIAFASKGKDVNVYSKFVDQYVYLNKVSQSLGQDIKQTINMQKTILKGGTSNITDFAINAGETSSRVLDQTRIFDAATSVLDRGENLTAAQIAEAKKGLTGTQGKLLDAWIQKHTAIKQAATAYDNISSGASAEEAIKGSDVAKKAWSLGKKYGWGTAFSGAAGAAVGTGVGVGPWAGAAIGDGLYALSKMLGSRGTSAADKLLITEAFLRPPKDVNELLRAVANHIEKSPTYEKTINNIKLFFLSNWGAIESKADKDKAIINRETRARYSKTP